MTVQQNIPALRFPEFEGEWENLPLSDEVEINPHAKALPEYFNYIDLESVESGKLLKNQEIELENAPSRAQRLLNKGDVLFQTVRPYQQNNFYFNLEGDYVASTGYAQLRTKSVPCFIYQVIHSEAFLNEVLVRCTGSSYPAINSNDLGEISIPFPTERERQKIAAFLTAVDEKIQQLTRKKALLEQYKKGVMQQLFSREIRFRDENGEDYPEWEERTLGEVTESIASGKSKLISEGQFPIYGSTGVIGFSDEYAHAGTYLLIARVGANAGYLNLVSGNFAVTDNTLILTPSKELNIDFAFQILQFKNLNKLVFGSGQPLITAGHLKSFTVEIPSLPEQQKIASFLSALDEKIGQVGQQLEQAKGWKKGLLQGMFV